MDETPYDDMNIRCPRCNSDKVTICEDSKGHFEVVGCYNCGYSKECNI